MRNLKLKIGAAFLSCFVHITLGHPSHATVITFSEGLVSPTSLSGSQHNLANQYDAAFGVTFFNSTCNNAWTLSNDNASANAALGSSLDGFHARSTCSSGDLLFRQPVDFVEIDFMLGVFTSPSDIVFDVLDPTGSVIASSSFMVNPAQSLSLVTGRIDAPGQIVHLRVSRGPDCCWDTLRFGPKISALGGAIPVPEPSTLAIFAIGLAGLGFFGWRRKRHDKAWAASA